MSAFIPLSSAVPPSQQKSSISCLVARPLPLDVFLHLARLQKNARPTAAAISSTPPTPQMTIIHTGDEFSDRLPLLPRSVPGRAAALLGQSVSCNVSGQSGCSSSETAASPERSGNIEAPAQLLPIGAVCAPATSVTEWLSVMCNGCHSSDGHSRGDGPKNSGGLKKRGGSVE
jgi:hypothetical protein